MTDIRAWSILLLMILVCGCGPRATSVAPEQGRGKPSVEQQRYVPPPVMRIVETNDEERHDGRHVKRGFVAVYDGPLDRESVEARFKTIYTAYRQEIERDYPQAVERWISVMLYADDLSRELGAPFARFETGLVRELPEWAVVKLEIESRDEATRLSLEDGQLLIRVNQARQAASKNFDRKFIDDRGIVRLPIDIERLAAVERERDAVKVNSERQVLTTLGKSEHDLQRAWAHWFVWSSGKAASAEAIEKYLRALPD